MSLTPADLLSREAYARQRAELRARLIAHRRVRSVMLGPWMRLQFEDELTVRYQIQEVLRIERVDDADSVQHEIDTYAHLLPDGRQWKATLLIELPDAELRGRELPLLNEAVHHLYVRAGRQPGVQAEANEDLHCRHRTRLSAVHFLRFPLPMALRAAVLDGAPVALGCAHRRYRWQRVIPAATLSHLRGELASAREHADAHRQSRQHPITSTEPGTP